jgi:hypothetical protein
LSGRKWPARNVASTSFSELLPSMQPSHENLRGASSGSCRGTGRRRSECTTPCHGRGQCGYGNQLGA